MNRVESIFCKLRPPQLLGRLSGPKVLLASVPKAGTNLLLRVLGLFPQLRYAGIVVGSPTQKQSQLDKIAQLKRGQFVVTHLDWMPELETMLDDQDIKVVFISRDPRDVCVSYYHHIMRHLDHWCHLYFQQHLPDDFSRLMAVITGLNEKLPDSKRLTLRSIDAHYRHRWGYMTHPRVVSVTFEDLVGIRGGGSDSRQEATIHRIAEHLGVRLSEKELAYIGKGAFSDASATFRKGRIAGWQKAMSIEHKNMFRRIAGQLLIDLGYEINIDW